MLWDTTFTASDALDLPSGKLGEVIGGITLERDFTSEQVCDAASYLIERCWFGAASSQAGLLVAAQQLGFGSQAPQLREMKYAPSRIRAALDAARAARRKLTTAKDDAARLTAQSEVEAAEAEFRSAKAELDAQLQEMQAQLPQLLGFWCQRFPELWLHHTAEASNHSGICTIGLGSAHLALGKPLDARWIDHTDWVTLLVQMLAH